MIDIVHPARPSREGAALENAVHVQLRELTRAFRVRPAPIAGYRGALWKLAGLTLVVAAITPVSALMVMALVDDVVSGAARTVLPALCAIGGIAVMFELTLRRQRSALAADVGVRAAAALALGWFNALLAQDSRRREPVSAELAHFRRLRRLRRLLTGPVVTALLDAPMTLAICLGLFVFAGPMAWAPLLALALHGAAAWALYPQARRTSQRGARARAALQEALAESATKRATLEELGMTGRWAARVEALSVEVATLRRRERRSDAAVDAVAHAIAALSIIAALWIGATMVMAHESTVGAVAAAMLMTWRCIAPVETVFRALIDVRFAAQALRQGTRADTAPASRGSHRAPLRVEGLVSLRGVVTAAAGGAALRGVNFDIGPGEIVAVCGGPGAGKSALLRTILGQIRPAAGTVVVDGRDLRDVEAASYRAQVAYAPQATTLFHGSVAQNIRLLAPGADDAAIEAALADAGVRLPHPQLPDGAATRLMSGGGGQIDESLRAKIMLAGLYAKGARLLLLDDPGAFLDRDGDRALLDMLASLRGRATVVLATNRPSHMRACDRIVRLEHGMIVSDGPSAMVLAR